MGARVELRDVGKRFGGVVALDAVSLAIPAGTVHALVGENGAGKSTLGKLLAGHHAPDRGELLLDGVPVRFRSPADALAAGVAMVHQELAVCPDLSVAENLVLGRWPTRGSGRRGVLRDDPDDDPDAGPDAASGAAPGAGRVPRTMGRAWSWPSLRWVDRAVMRARARAQLAALGVELDVDASMRRLPVAQTQLVQVAHALGVGARLLVFDEPTAALSAPEAERLLALVERLRAEGRTIVLVSHRLPEVLRLADTASVLRDGRLVASFPREALQEQVLVKAMVGRDSLVAAFRAGPPAASASAPAPSGAWPGAVRLRVSGLTLPRRRHDISLEARAGEIVGLAGLVGAGRSELLRALFGLEPRARGRLEVDGTPVPLARVAAARRGGVALVPEDRQREWLVLLQGARFNWSLPRLAAWRRPGTAAFGRGWLAGGRERAEATEAMARVDLRAADLEAPVETLSGGNQQKVVLARWLDAGAGVLLVDEPTRGVDVGAKAQIHALLRARAAAGAALLVASSELPELLALCDRILVVRDGRLVAERARADADEESLLRAMAGVGAA